LPVWQALQEELGAKGFTVITVALDRSPEDARPWIEKAKPTHPSLIDTEFRVADLFGMVNVPTIVWIDESGKIVRPNDVAFATDTYKAITGMDAAKSLGAIRAWVLGESRPLDAATIHARQALPTAEHQQARAEFGLARWLWSQGNQDAANRHFARADELAPDDWTIRRGSMLMRGMDPFGQDFRTIRNEWVGAGHAYYLPLPD
jgi:hypothetical protein